jgi:excisionase family DNA binding protein
MTEKILPKGFTRITDAADYLSPSKSKLYLMMGDGQIAYVKLGKSRCIPWSEVFTLVEQHTIPARKS